MEDFALETNDLLKTPMVEGEIRWFKTRIQPPNKKDTNKNQTIVKMMIATIFQTKHPECDPYFLITWNPREKCYHVGLTRF
jgi:hypothetical protein